MNNKCERCYYWGSIKDITSDDKGKEYGLCTYGEFISELDSDIEWNSDFIILASSLIEHPEIYHFTHKDFYCKAFKEKMK